ncbi:RNA polymerase sigma-70 factor, ECF subfamily [Mariniphaga anaerophila]|uniref:RNA polymerase sigma-70 factor, ECF subfamily n=1 Tax=Mariniphaga anaerophila TaxID=1484053 RepID=A0A1M4Y786_9BACT|nr:RNA polymerase sigma-70 factor [Mariniphaga anaerophila]SHF01565.1 RNA polymerase sigma-70 factor, ECF subfamily [Mariniphaga anaerophila]
MEDNNLWENIKKGDRNRFKELHDKYFHQMYLYAFKSVDGDSGLAEELVSDCFIKIWENRKKLNIETSVKHYLFIILRNGIIDHLRKQKVFTEPIPMDIMAPGDEKDFDDQRQYVRLYMAVKKLPEQCRRVLELAAFESLSYQEIADSLQISKNTVKTQMGRAYKQLKEMLDPKDFNFFLMVCEGLF